MIEGRQGKVAVVELLFRDVASLNFWGVSVVTLRTFFACDVLLW